MQDAAAADRVAVIQRHGLPATADFLFRTYSAEPEFAQLFGLAPGDDLHQLRPLFQGIIASVAHIPGTTLGCYRDGKMIGAICFFPDLRVPFLRLLLQRSARVVLALLRHLLIKVRWRPRLMPRA